MSKNTNIVHAWIFFFCQTIFLSLKAAKIGAWFVCLLTGHKFSLGKDRVSLDLHKTSIKYWFKGYYFNVLPYKEKYSSTCDNLM